ncbi:hypothetical protein C922_04119 [Plasmodium inui San Antonio 1]|uniref:Uncharacterized protein n=1 Tax=Plasmodium inui San Antonio 1 TaxID=1237626 RepID=W7A8A4_9APIC|nr:hypothetical protein C922_04119 [Plasmodium inui San Antonio 1]EUD65379.1 hypothetical protein C922_04119 [Plasmodium inui San Antonio 1]
MKGSINSEGGQGDADHVVREEKMGHERDDQSQAKSVTLDGLSSLIPNGVQLPHQGAPLKWGGMNHHVRITQPSSPSKESGSERKSFPLKSIFLTPITKHTILRSISAIRQGICAKCAMPGHPLGGTGATRKTEPTIKSLVKYSFQANEKKK